MVAPGEFFGQQHGDIRVNLIFADVHIGEIQLFRQRPANVVIGHHAQLHQHFPQPLAGLLLQFQRVINVFLRHKFDIQQDRTDCSALFHNDPPDKRLKACSKQFSHPKIRPKHRGGHERG